MGFVLFSASMPATAGLQWSGVLVIPARSSAEATVLVVIGGTVIVLLTTLMGARLGVVTARQVPADG